MKDKAAFVEKLSFGLGDFSNNGIFTFVASYLMYFYTDVAGMDLAAIGIILLIGRIVDAAFSPIMGLVVDKVHTKFGRCRPFLIIGIVPACALMILMFMEWDIKGPLKTAAAIGIYGLFSLTFAFMNVPYSTMLTVLTADNRERISFNMYKNIGANGGGMFVTALTLWLVSRLGKTPAEGFTKTALVFGVLFTACTLLCVKNTKERVSAEPGEQTGFLVSMKTSVKNKSWCILCAVQFLSLTYMMIRQQSMVYYAKYCLGKESISALLLAIMPFVSMVLALVLPGFAKKRSLKFFVRFGNLLWCIAMAGTFFCGNSIAAVVAFHILASIGWAFATGMVFVMISELVDYSKKQTGCRPQGFMTSVIALAQKLGVACSGYICALVLDIGGYTAAARPDGKALMAIRVNFAVLPFVLSAVVMIIISFYNLEEE